MGHILLCTFPKKTGLLYEVDFLLKVFNKKSIKIINATLNFKNNSMENKKTILKFRVTETEKKIILERAKNTNKSFSEYARKMLVNGEIISISPEEKRIIGGLSNNINQLTKLYHINQKEPQALQIELANLINILKDAYRRST